MKVLIRLEQLERGLPEIYEGEKDAIKAVIKAMR
jgi:hypothetical protein